MTMALRLEQFDVDPMRGFLPSIDPLTSLPPPFDAWDRIAAILPLLVMTGRVSTTLAALPVLDATGLTTTPQRRRALLLLAGFANTWMATPAMPPSIPRGISIPLLTIAAALGTAPITTHATIVLGNWRRLDPAEPLSLENVDTLLSFRGSIDEKWFFLATLGVELTGATVPAHLLEAVAAADTGDHVRLATTLSVIANQIDAMTMAFMRVRESCTPYIFYHHVRPFLAGWPAPGVVYEGTGVGPVQYSGGSAAQSSLLQSIDAALGIRHEHALTRTFLTSMRAYMPPRHRAFIEVLASRSRVRAVASDAYASAHLRAAYDRAIAAMDTLRRRHIGLVSEYITRQMPPSSAAIGTGGTSFDDFLRQSRIETVQSKLDESS